MDEVITKTTQRTVGICNFFCIFGWVRCFACGQTFCIFSKLCSSCLDTVRCVNIYSTWCVLHSCYYFIYPWLHCSNCKCLCCRCDSKDDTTEMHCRNFRLYGNISFINKCCICPSFSNKKALRLPMQEDTMSLSAQF